MSDEQGSATTGNPADCRECQGILDAQGRYHPDFPKSTENWEGACRCCGHLCCRTPDAPLSDPAPSDSLVALACEVEDHFMWLTTPSSNGEHRGVAHEAVAAALDLARAVLAAADKSRADAEVTP